VLFWGVAKKIPKPGIKIDLIPLKPEKPTPQHQLNQKKQRLKEKLVLRKSLLEAVFRSLKSELGMHPVFHQITKRVTGHLFISVLAYHLAHSIRYRLKKAEINSSWSDLKKQLTGQSRVTVSMHC